LRQRPAKDRSGATGKRGSGGYRKPRQQARNALAHAGRSGRRVVSAFIATAFAQDDAAQAKAQWRRVADQLRPKVPKLATLMDRAEAALPASDLALVVLPAVDGRMRERSASKRPAGPRERPRLQPGEMATGSASWDDVEVSDTGPRQGQAGARSSRRETRTSAVEEAKQVILEILEVASEPLGKSDVLGRASHTGRPIDSAWNEAINNLLSARRVAKAGEKRGTRYWLSHPPAGQSGEHSA